MDCVGTRRFRVLEQWDQDGYLCGKVQYFDDEPLATDEAKHEFKAVAEETRTKLSEALARVPRDVSQRLQQLLARAGDIPANDVDFGFWLSAYIPIGQAAQQELLEMTNPIERMKRLSAHLTPSSADQCITM